MITQTQIKNSILLLMIIISLTSCDVLLSGSGIVIDEISQRPIDSVLVEAFLTDKNESIFVEQMYTDSAGRFNLRTGPIGNNNQDLILLFSKEGYNNLIAIEPDGENIILERNTTKRNYLQTYYRRQLGVVK